MIMKNHELMVINELKVKIIKKPIEVLLHLLKRLKVNLIEQAVPRYQMVKIEIG
jgi:hypothetical protein